MKKLVLVLALLTLLATTASVSAIKDIDYGRRCDFVQPATDYRPERVFEGIGIYGRFVTSTFDPDLNKTVYKSVLKCFLPYSKPKHKEESAPVVVPEPPCVPTEVCEDVTYEQSPSWECTRWVGFGHGRHCQSYGWVCEEGYRLECSDWSCHGHFCVDWTCTKTEQECHMTGCEV